MRILEQRAGSAAERATFWRAADLGNTELLHANYITHCFARHSHDGYAIGMIERGAETFWYRGANHVAPMGSLVIINPGETHTGQAVSEGGWTYRMLYPPAGLLQQAATDLAGAPRPLPFFPAPVVRDPHLAERLRRLHMLLGQPSSSLERESGLLALFAGLVARHADAPPEPFVAGKEHGAVARVREYLEMHSDANPSLGELARLTGLSPFHLLRVFRAAAGLPPHAYLTQIRLRRARALLAAGLSVAQVAQDTGFADQSHLTRHFKRLMGITPGQYRLGSKIVQDVGSGTG